MINALWITLIGMGLVFVAILFLWGLMVLLVRVTAEAEPKPELAAAEEDLLPAPVLENDSRLDCKQRAAAAAVAFALALEQQNRSTVSNHRALPAAGISAWQAVNRSQQINQRISTRKKETR